jgi:2-polyprenyl-3-methyl-5-hydroxy-6-metoxy-1,4-benzoquinol methylase
MSKEKSADYYNAIFKESESYQCDYKNSKYYFIWAYIVQALRKIPNPKILEIGCGTGQLAHYLYDEGFHDYYGFDFSEEAVKIARRRVPLSFDIANALDGIAYDRDYNVVIATEVFEHIENDKAILKNIKRGAHVFISLPTFNSPAHVRCFKTSISILHRYYNFIESPKIFKMSKWFVCHGTKQIAITKGLGKLFKSRNPLNIDYLKDMTIQFIKSLVR